MGQNDQYLTQEPVNALELLTNVGAINKDNRFDPDAISLSSKALIFVGQAVANLIWTVMDSFDMIVNVNAESTALTAAIGQACYINHGHDIAILRFPSLPQVNSPASLLEPELNRINGKRIVVFETHQNAFWMIDFVNAIKQAGGNVVAVVYLMHRGDRLQTAGVEHTLTLQQWPLP